MRKSTIPELNNREDLARLYEQSTCSEIADRLGCCWETVRKRLVKFGIPRRKGAVSSKQTRIEKAEMYIRQMLRPWPVETQAHILRPIVKELGSVM